MAGFVDMVNEWLVRALVLLSLAGAMAGLVNLENEWLVRALVLLSLAAHLVLVVFAEIRRRKASGWRRGILWLAYQLADWAATTSIGKLFLDGTSHEQQLVAFWLPFLLIHLGRPDNISAYALEDNVLSGRQVVDAVTQVVGAGYVLYKYIIIGGGGVTFLAASVIMFLVGIIKYLERVWAQWKADLGSIQSSGKIRRTALPGDPGRDSEQALLVAHDLFHITEGAFADYSSVYQDPLNPHTRDGWPYGWEEMCKVVEMELSIMYDVLYTKAKVIHTWCGYVIRAASPFFTFTAFLLFLFSSKDGQRRADVIITYILLAATFLLDMRWLLRALLSAGTYAFLKDKRCHQLLCTGRWHRLRRVVVSLDPGHLLKSRAQEENVRGDVEEKEPTSYRMWSGRIGQYNLLHECTHETTSPWTTLAKKVGLEDWQYHYLRGLDIPLDVREKLFVRIWEKLKLAYPARKEAPAAPPAAAAAALPPPVDVGARRRKKLDEALSFDPEFHVDILFFHIATDVFLLCPEFQNDASCTNVKAIKALSNYMLFLAAVRPYMLPTMIKLSSLHKATSDALQEIWISDNKYDPDSGTREEVLASILLKMEQEERTMNNQQADNVDKKRSLYGNGIILSDATRFAKVLLGRLTDKDQSTIRDEVGIGGKYNERLDRLISELWGREYVWNSSDLLDYIFDVWVRMLIYVSTRCSRESHAKQLSRGGELTTIVWILAEHAGVFGINEDTNTCSTNTCSVM